MSTLREKSTRGIGWTAAALAAGFLMALTALTAPPAGAREGDPHHAHSHPAPAEATAPTEPTEGTEAAEAMPCHGPEAAAAEPAKEAPEATRIPQTAGPIHVPDVTLRDQDGRELHFYRDLVQGKTVLINFVFTTCTTVCPPMGATFSKVQKLLGDRSGRDVQLISVSVDPAVDTPERLKAWGTRFGAGPGWTLVTGDKGEVDRLLKALAVYTADKGDHSPLVLAGNEAAGRWTRAYGLARPEEMIALVDGLATPQVAAMEVAP